MEFAVYQENTSNDGKEMGFRGNRIIFALEYPFISAQPVYGSTNVSKRVAMMLSISSWIYSTVNRMVPEQKLLSKYSLLLNFLAQTKF